MEERDELKVTIVSSQGNWSYDTALKRKNKRGGSVWRGKKKGGDASCRTQGAVRHPSKVKQSSGVGSLKVIPVNRKNTTEKLPIYLWDPGIEQITLAKLPSFLASRLKGEREKQSVTLHVFLRSGTVWIAMVIRKKEHDVFTVGHIPRVCSFLLPCNKGSMQLCWPNSLNWVRDRPRAAPRWAVEIDRGGLSYTTLPGKH